MAAATYEAWIRLANGNTQHVRVQADGAYNAKAMIESQYGRGCILNGPNRVSG